MNPRQKIILLATLAAMSLAAAGCGGAAKEPVVRWMQRGEAEQLLAQHAAAGQNGGDADTAREAEPDPAQMETHADLLRRQQDPTTALYQYGRALALLKSKSQAPPAAGAPKAGPPATDTADQRRVMAKMGGIYLENRQFHQAASIFERLAAEEPNRAEYWQALGLARLGLDEEDGALVALNRAVELDRRLWRANNALGMIFNRRRQPDEALFAFEAAIAERPRLAELYNNQAVSHIIKRDWPRAEESLKKALIIKPSYNLALNNLGLVLFKQKRPQEAWAAFERSLGASGAYNNLGCLLAWQGNVDEAAGYFHRAQATSPRYYPLATRHLADARQESGPNGAPAGEALDLGFSANRVSTAPRRTAAAEPMAVPVAYRGDGRELTADRLQATAPRREAPTAPKPAAAKPLQAGQGGSVGLQGGAAEKHEANLVEGLWLGQDGLFHRGQGNPGGLVQGVAVGAGGDAGEGHRAQAVASGQGQTGTVAGGEQQSVLGAAPVDGTHRVDDVPGGKPAGRGNDRLAGRAVAQAPALGHDVRAAGPVDGPVHAAPAAQGAVGSVDDGVQRHTGDISLGQGKPGGADGDLVGHGAPPSGLAGEKEEQPALVLHPAGQASGVVPAAVEKVQPARTPNSPAGVLVEYEARQGTNPGVWRGSLAN